MEDSQSQAISNFDKTQYDSQANIQGHCWSLPNKAGGIGETVVPVDQL